MLRFQSLLSIAALGVCLAACGDSSAPQAFPPSAQAQEARSPEFASLPTPYAQADYARAERVWRQCSSCHAVAPDADHLVGPTLHGVIGRKAGRAEGFKYSQALREANIMWTPEELDKFLASPRKYIPGNNMRFSGLRKQSDRHNIIAYLMLESGWTDQ